MLVGVALAVGGCAAEYAPQRGKPETHKQQADKSRQAAVAEGALAEAETLIAQQRYTEAFGQLKPLAAPFEAAGDAKRAAKVMFWMAYCHEKQGQATEAADLYERVAKRYPETPATRQAAERLAIMRGAAVR
jgi:TolA-binding protein